MIEIYRKEDLEWPFLLKLVQIGPRVSEEKIKM